MNKPAKNPALPSFETVEQLMADTYLKGRIQANIDDIMAERNRVSEGGKKKLKASPVETLIKLNLFTPEFFTSEYLEVSNKRSKYPFEIRELITYMIQECVGDTFKHYESLFDKQQRKTAKSKQS